MALSPSNWHACFHENYPGIIPGSEDEVALAAFYPLRTWSTHHAVALDGAPWPVHFYTAIPSCPLASVLQCPDTCSVCVPVLNSSI